MTKMAGRGLESHQLVETRTLKFKLSPPKLVFPQPPQSALPFPLPENSNTQQPCHGEVEISRNAELGGWSFLQALAVPSKEAMVKQEVYIHPLVKRSLSFLSEKSLALCTENLGNETGTDMVESSIMSSLSSADSKCENSRSRAKSHLPMEAKKARPRNFPPPLTTMSGSESLRVRTHREDGRLIIEAVKTSERPSYFRAERSHGRLRLCFLKRNTATFDAEEASKEDIEDPVDMDMGNDDKEFYSGGDQEEDEEDEDFAEDIRLERGDDVRQKKGMDGDDDDSKNVGGEMGMEKFEIPASRCKEGEHESNGLLSWELLWVATS